MKPFSVYKRSKSAPSTDYSVSTTSVTRLSLTSIDLIFDDKLPLKSDLSALSGERRLTTDILAVLSIVEVSMFRIIGSSILKFV